MGNDDQPPHPPDTPSQNRLRVPASSAFPVGNLQNQPIIGHLNAFRQAGRGLLVRQIVADVGEIGAIRTDPGRRLQRLTHTEVGRMRPMPQGIDNQRPHARQERPARLRDGAAIGEVGEVTKAEGPESDAGRAESAPARFPSRQG